MKDKAFSDELRSRLSRYKYASWAADLSEETVESLLWAIGESHIRLHEDFLKGCLEDVPPPVRTRILVGIRIAREIVGGREVSLEDVQRRIREAVAEVWPEDTEG